MHAIVHEVWHNNTISAICGAMKQLIFPLVLCLLASGCVGGGVRWTSTVTIEHPTISDPPWVCNVRNRMPGDTNTLVYTSAWLQEHWGKPTTVSRTGGDGAGENWTYRFSHSWSGLYLYVLIQIPPIALPVGKNAVSFTLRQDQVVSAKRSVSRMGGGAIGFSTGPCTPLNKFGVFSLADDGCHEDHP
jgi:hypothetical protein